MAAMNPPDDDPTRAESPETDTAGDAWEDAARQAAEHRARTRSRTELTEDLDPDSTAPDSRTLINRLGAPPSPEASSAPMAKHTEQKPASEEASERTRTVDPWVAASRRAALQGAAENEGTRLRSNLNAEDARPAASEDSLKDGSQEEPQERTRRVDPWVSASRRAALRQAAAASTEASTTSSRATSTTGELAQDDAPTAETFLAQRRSVAWHPRARDRWWGIPASPNTAIVVDGDHVFVDGVAVAPVPGLETPAALGIYAVAQRARQLGREVRATGHDDHDHTYLGVDPHGGVRIVKSPSSISVRRMLISAGAVLLAVLAIMVVLGVVS